MENKVDLSELKAQIGLSEDDFFQLLLDALPVEIFVKDAKGKYLYVNEALCKNDGLPRSNYLGKKDINLLKEELYSIYSETDKEALRSDKGISFTTDTENTKNVRTFKMPFKKEDGTLIGIAGYSYDSTISVEKMKEITTELTRYAGVFKNAILGIGIYDSIAGSAVEVNDMYSTITGRSKEDLLTLPWESYSHPGEIPETQEFLKLMSDGKIDAFNMEKRYVKPNGSTVWVHISVARLKNEANPDSHITMIMDINDRKEAEDKAKYYYEHDAMTGLYNRRFGDQKLIELDKAEYLPLSIIMSDANGLKLTNDAFGHMEGDRLLKKLSNIFLESVGPGDYVIRTGGDEFMAILPNTEGTEALEVIKKINNRLEEDTADGFILSMAMGCATRVSLDENLDQIYQSAEGRMYHNKIKYSNAHKIKVIEHLQKKMGERNSSFEQHCLNVKRYATELGEAAGLGKESLLELGLAAYYHDIGKIGLDPEIANKKESLDEKDWMNVMKHPEIGYQILKSIPEYARVADYVLFHHERVDGVGYPSAYKDKDIPIPAKILSLAEAYSDMTMNKVYRKRLTKEEAIMEIQKGFGTQFDEDLARLFIDKVLPKY